jgi:hypothetical protein
MINIKKLLGIVVLCLLYGGSAFSEVTTLICTFDKYVENPTSSINKKIISKNELIGSGLDEDKFIVLENLGNNNIKILETSLDMMMELKKPKDRVVKPTKITDRYIKFNGFDKISDGYSFYVLNRFNGNLTFEIYSNKSIQTVKLDRNCKIKEKLF